MEILIKEGEVIDLYSLPEFTVGQVITVQNKSRTVSAFLTSDASEPEDLNSGLELTYPNIALTESGDTNAWVAAPDGDLTLFARV